MLLNLTHVVADVVIEWSPEEKHVLNPLLGHSPKDTTVHHKLLSLVYSLKTTPRLVHFVCHESQTDGVAV